MALISVTVVASVFGCYLQYVRMYVHTYVTYMHMYVHMYLELFFVAHGQVFFIGVEG